MDFLKYLSMILFFRSIFQVANEERTRYFRNYYESILKYLLELDWEGGFLALIQMDGVGRRV